MEPNRPLVRPIDMGDTGVVAALFAEQDGVITIEQALACGLTPKQVRGRVDRGEWITIVRGIYRSASHPPTERLLVRAAAAAHRGVVDRTTAAWWHGMLADLPYPLTVATTGTPSAARWPFGPVDLLRRRYQPADISRVDGLTVTSAPVTAVFGAAAMPDGAQFLDRVLQTEAVTVDQLQAVLDRYAGSRGIQEARHLVRVASSDSESEAERIFARLLKEAGITGWVQQFPFGPWKLDFAWPHLKVAVEIDGWAFHHQHDRFGSDRAKLNALEDAEWRKKIYTWHNLTDRPGRVIDEVVDLLNAAMAAA